MKLIVAPTLAVSCAVFFASTSTSTAFLPSKTSSQSNLSIKSTPLFAQKNSNDNSGVDRQQPTAAWRSTLAATAMGLAITTSGLFGGGLPAVAGDSPATYDGFADYAKENQMEKSDVSCFINKCGDQTKNLFSNPRGIKGITCLGQCKGEQACAVRCFAEFGSKDLNNWLSCTLEENECVKIPKNIDNSAEFVGYSTTVRKFDPSHLVGKWYKTNGLNPNYDMFDCQYNTFEPTTSDNSELDMGIFLRVQRPPEVGGGFFENVLSEHMIVDAAITPNQPAGSRTMHTEGKMNGLTFDEQWYILGESDGKGDIPPFVLVAYKGHTLQGNYEGSFVYSKEPVLPQAAIPAIRDAASKAGLNWDDYKPIDNTW